MTTDTAAKPLREAFSPFIVPLLAAAVFINYVDRGTLGIAAPRLKADLGLSATQYGLAASAFFWAYAPGQLVAGWLVGRGQNGGNTGWQACSEKPEAFPLPTGFAAGMIPPE